MSSMVNTACHSQGCIQYETGIMITMMPDVISTQILRAAIDLQCSVILASCAHPIIVRRVCYSPTLCFVEFTRIVLSSIIWIQSLWLTHWPC